MRLSCPVHSDSLWIKHSSTRCSESNCVKTPRFQTTTAITLAQAQPINNTQCIIWIKCSGCVYVTTDLCKQHCFDKSERDNRCAWQCFDKCMFFFSFVFMYVLPPGQGVKCTTFHPCAKVWVNEPETRAQKQKNRQNEQERKEGRDRFQDDDDVAGGFDTFFYESELKLMEAQSGWEWWVNSNRNSWRE